MRRLPRTPAGRMGAFLVFRDLLRRVDEAVTFDEFRALRRFVRRRLEDDDRLASFDEAVEQHAMAMIAESEAAGKANDS